MPVLVRRCHDVRRGMRAVAMEATVEVYVSVQLARPSADDVHGGYRARSTYRAFTDHA